jgi:predicted TIM-barrel fold metal-dependent hydrolase
MRSIDIHAHLTPQCFWKATENVFGTDWPYDMALDWPVAWVLGMKGLTQEEKEAILSKNLEKLLDL